MAETMRINSILKERIEEYKKLKMAYCKKYWDDDIIFKQMYESLQESNESDLLVSALIDSISQLKYDEKINL